MELTKEEQTLVIELLERLSKRDSAEKLKTACLKNLLAR